MKPADVRSKTKDELDSALSALKREQFNLRFQKATGQIEKTSCIRQVRRDIARVKTVLSEKSIIVKVKS